MHGIFRRSILLDREGFGFLGSDILDLPSPQNHRENGGTLGMVPLIINPIYTLYSGYLDVFIG